MIAFLWFRQRHLTAARISPRAQAPFTGQAFRGRAHLLSACRSQGRVPRPPYAEIGPVSSLSLCLVQPRVMATGHGQDPQRERPWVGAGRGSIEACRPLGLGHWGGLAGGRRGKTPQTPQISSGSPGSPVTKRHCSLGSRQQLPVVGSVSEGGNLCVSQATPSGEGQFRGTKRDVWAGRAGPLIQGCSRLASTSLPWCGERGLWGCQD